MTAPDVNDPTSFEKYSKKREEWKRLISGEGESHSFELDALPTLTHQFSTLFFYDALYNTVLHVTELYPDNNSPDVGYNGWFMHMVIENFFAVQGLRIRKLIDSNKFPDGRDKPDSKKVISLRGLQEDIVAHKDLLTRENYVCYGGMPYENAPSPPDWPRGKVRRVPQEGWVPGTLHTEFDKLSGVAEKDRKRGDPIDVSKAFTSIDYTKFDGVKVMCDKFIAHAASPESRAHASVALEAVRLDLDTLESAYGELVRAAKIISDVGGESILTEVPVPQSDHLENLTKPLVRESDMHKLTAQWKERSDFFNALARG